VPAPQYPTSGDVSAIPLLHGPTTPGPVRWQFGPLLPGRRPLCAIYLAFKNCDLAMTFTVRFWDFDMDSDVLGPIRCAHLDAMKKFSEFEDSIRTGTVDSTALARDVFRTVARRRTGDAEIDAKCGGSKFREGEVSTLPLDELDQFCDKLTQGRLRLVAPVAGAVPPPAAPAITPGRDGLAAALLHVAERSRAATKRTLDAAEKSLGAMSVLDAQQAALGGASLERSLREIRRSEELVWGAMGTDDILKSALGSTSLSAATEAILGIGSNQDIIKAALGIDDPVKSFVDQTSLSSAAQTLAGIGRSQDMITGSAGIGDPIKSLLGPTQMSAIAQTLAGIGHSEDIVRGLQIADQVRRRQDIENLFGGDMAVSLAAAEETRLRQLVDNAIGVDRFAATSQANTLAQIHADQLRGTVHDRFLLLGHSEAARTLEIMRGNYFGSVLDHYSNQLPRAQEAMLDMQAPWLDSLRAVESIRGFAELQAIGGALTVVPSFGDDFSALLRADLGDWRDRITNWSDVIGESAAARHSLYVDRGLNTDLTDFPEKAFDEGLALAGILGEQPILVVEYGQLTSLFIDDDENKGLARTNVAHDHLQRFEFQLRKFIDRTLTKVVGANWPKQRLPNGLYDKWQFKKSNDKGDAVDWPLIAYADFTEYVDIICRSDNWKEAFEPVFKRKESVRESFQRMYAIRLAIAHARPITNADALFLYVEVKRLLDALPPVT